MNPLDAAKELRASWSRWQELGRNLPRWEATARGRYQDALARDDDAAAEGAMVAWVAVRELQQEYEVEARRWRWVAALVPFLAPDSGDEVAWEYAPTGSGLLGAVPVLWPVGLVAAAAAVVALAGAVRSIFRKATPAERVVSALERGDLTAEQAQRILAGLADAEGDGLGIGAGLAIVGAALVAAVALGRRS